MNGTLVETGPKMDWTRDNKIYDRYLLWKDKSRKLLLFNLADATPQQKTGYLRLWMGDEGVPLIKKWVSTGKMDFSDPIGRPASGSRARVPPSNGFILQTFWDLLEIELKPKGNKLLSIIELWTHSKQSDKPLNEQLTSIYNLLEVCDYPEDSKDRIIRDALIIGCSSDKAKDKIV